jgi:hypothetical protein
MTLGLVMVDAVSGALLGELVVFAQERRLSALR